MRADRLVSIVLLLQTRGRMTASTLATELGVNRRTILRDIDALSLAGVPVYAEGGHGGGISLDKDYRTNLTGLTEQEARALFLTGNKPLLAEIGFGPAVESTERKLAAALPARHHAAVEFMRQRIYIDPLWWWHETEPQAFWPVLQRAVYEDRLIQVTYENYNREVIERRLEPYSLVCKSSYWYLVARREDDWRTYRVSRIQQLEVLEQTFERKAAFDLESYWQTHLNEFASTFSEFEFTLCIHPDRLNFLRWLTPGRNQLLGTRADGWLIFRCHLESAGLATMLVIGLGDQCEVLEPASLVEEVIRTCRAALSHLQ
jgi:predicted DNA-binding transcriptional regulator YafY